MSDVKCGYCKNRHSIAQVRECATGSRTAPVTAPTVAPVTDLGERRMAYAVQAATTKINRGDEDAKARLDRLMGEPATYVTPKAPSAAQISYMLSLQNQHASQIDKAYSEAEISMMTRQTVSSHISRLKALPAPVAKPASFLATTQVTLPVSDVPAGRYALRTSEGIKFYIVDRPTDGPWKGRIFVSALASDTKYPLRNNAHRAEILRNIFDAGVKESMILFGKELGKCGHCGRTLTDENSRAAGIGPICAEKF